jgi:hypothetical protein
MQFMVDPMKAVVKPVTQPAELEVALEGACRASADATSSAATAQPEVVAIARHRQFSIRLRKRYLKEHERRSAGRKGAVD